MKSEPRIPVSALRAQAADMVANGTMPPLEKLLEIVAGVRAKYVPLIKTARLEARRED